MRKRLTMALAAGALVAAIVPGVTSGAEPIGQCPSAFALVEDARSEGGLRNRNGDGWVCFVDNTLGIWIDNRLPLTS